MKAVPASFEERIKLPADNFADPANRRFYIASSDDLTKLRGRIRRLSDRDTVRQNALRIAAKNSLEIPAALMFPWEDVQEPATEAKTDAVDVTITSEDLVEKEISESAG